ncbi:hypothetical protein HBI56_048600 [Parastagonospora nodorum]|nr:hypothetical protein HBH56_061530 [Parastagonospora nodorum]KAH3930770.1 hypothetical protein HBH54_105470 [Parastagonospora nodorum]KAH3977160.1 hypothetical protein HBH52_114560 [Parastagonospora nodorum]KAH4022391.1 hypothetical protein HBI13_101990 [Parastagonospora nodorum]KAH4103274.1 hypothetical protein HBH46_117370 [Parastagonospora nodorum]
MNCNDLSPSLIGPLLSVPNEITLAAANSNVNFSLMKFEAPPEFHGLRDALSRTRRHEAEEGMPHITARCLGALFETIIPQIPRITVAYGTRVSEICAQLQLKTQPTGMFADQAGADGTSIWAAATSGQHAIAMHLLSCMLARIWKPAEATSLWVELVERRKQEIFKDYNSSSATGISAIMAAQQLFNREQLSAWDASARSWLQTADTTKRFQQTQLMLIINNVRMPVNTSKDPYDSIISAWKSGLSAMESLLQGASQRVQDGAILLAISSWHLYPNMQVLSDLVKDIDMSDDLMTHSILTISTSGTSDSRDGVFWSLPLSRMRYYSPALVSERTLASDTSRITMEEFHIVVLGAFVSQWKTTCSDEIRCCKVIARIYQAYQGLLRGQQRPLKIPKWFNLIAAAAHRVLDSSGQMQAQYHKLLKLGSRRCGAFLHDPEYTPPTFFGLGYFHILYLALGSRDADVLIQTLPIAYAEITMSDARRHVTPTRNVAIALIPYYHSTAKAIGGEEVTLIHPEYLDVVDEYQFCIRQSEKQDPHTYSLLFGHGTLAAIYQIQPEISYDTYNQDVSNAPSATIEEIESVVYSDSFDPSSLELETCCDHWLGDGMVQTCCSLDALTFASELYGSMPGATVSIEIMAFPMYERAWAIYRQRLSTPSANPKRGMWWHSDTDEQATIPANEGPKSDWKSIADNFDEEIIPETLDDPKSRNGLKDPSSEHSHASRFVLLDGARMRLSRSFACVAWFDSGEFDLFVNQLNAVMALINGNSIYVASALLSDPSIPPSGTPITRVFGNLGRSEMSLLVPPVDPRLAELDLSSWKHINHSHFTGRLQDCFSSTSLHLTFTDSEDTVYLGNRGLRDRQVVFLEALVSIDDRGKHIGDLDILSMFSKPTFEVQKSCSHTPEERADVLLGCRLIAIDNWDEFLDPPERAAIFRANGNWQARLGAAAAAIQMGMETLVLSAKRPCLQCLKMTGVDMIIA